YGPFVTALRRHTRALGPEKLSELFEGRAFLAAALVPEAARLIGLPNQTSARDDLFAAVWHLMNNLCRPSGSALLLEDLHWADADSLSLFSYLAREAADIDLWLVGTYRSDELEREHPVLACLAELQRERRYEELPLSCLGRDELGEMVSAIFDGERVSDDFLDVLLERTEGNPFFVEELMKVLVERGDIYFAGDTWARRDLDQIELPASVRETLLSRVRALEPRALEAALALQPEQTRARLELLLEAANAMAEPRDWRLPKAFATEALQLARQFHDPLAEGRAIMVLQREGWQAGETHPALAMLREAAKLVHGRDDEQEADVLARLVRLLVLADQDTEATKLLGGAVELATRAGNGRALSLLHGSRMLIARDNSELFDAFAAATSAAQAAADEYAEHNLTTNAAYTLLWRGNFALSHQSFLRAEELVQRVAPNDEYVRAGYAWLQSLLGEYDEVLSKCERLRYSAAVPTRIVALTALYETLERRGDLAAGAVVDELLECATRTGESQRSVPAYAARARCILAREGLSAAAPRFWEALHATTNVLKASSHWGFAPDFACALAEEGRTEELARWVDVVGELTQGDPHDHNLPSEALCRAHLAVAQGELKTGRELLQRAASLYEALPCPARWAEALVALAQLELRADDVEASATAARQALSVADGIGAAAVSARARRALERAETPSVLATILFTDIVGSTERAAALGDRAWRALLERHNMMVRRELERWNGRELDTTGDGFLASFATPAQAIRCALAIQNELAALGIKVRAGLHTGECQASGEKLAGITVHIASRICANAEAGEVLVSGTVRDLVAGSSFVFAERGRHQLKGVPGDWALLAVSR
ncbi:MAG TPA: adenylate/guanylate cyclase domain-containing protein, partial [Acidimicrobiales bacterium]|nr:adenylate/guanylate cyclase domain-containing protein [Acidimicrobiales bacterium]